MADRALDLERQRDEMRDRAEAAEERAERAEQSVIDHIADKRHIIEQHDRDIARHAALREALQRIAQHEVEHEDEGQPDFYAVRSIARAVLLDAALAADDQKGNE